MSIAFAWISFPTTMLLFFSLKRTFSCELNTKIGTYYVQAYHEAWKQWQW